MVDGMVDGKLIEPAQFFDISASDKQPFMPQIVFLYQRLLLLCSYAPKLRHIMNSQNSQLEGDGVYRETLESLRILWNHDDPLCSIIGRQCLMERQLWHLLDLRDAGGFGFLVERFLLMLAQLLYITSRDATTLYLGTFKVLTAGWRQHKHSIGTWRVILNIICDIAIPDRGIVSNRTYPEYITDELLALSGNMVEGQSGLDIDKTIHDLSNNLHRTDVNAVFATKAIGLISRKRAQAPLESL